VALHAQFRVCNCTSIQSMAFGDHVHHALLAQKHVNPASHTEIFQSKARAQFAALSHSIVKAS
jgi:hypothetical protein